MLKTRKTLLTLILMSSAILMTVALSGCLETVATDTKDQNCTHAGGSQSSYCQAWANHDFGYSCNKVTWSCDTMLYHAGFLVDVEIKVGINSDGVPFTTSTFIDGAGSPVYGPHSAKGEHESQIANTDDASMWHNDREISYATRESD